MYKKSNFFPPRILLEPAHPSLPACLPPLIYPPSPSTLLPCHSLSVLSLLSPSPPAGGEHFLMGENLTVAVLGLVIPIGESPSLFLFVVSVHPSRPAGLREAACPPAAAACLRSPAAAERRERRPTDPLSLSGVIPCVSSDIRCRAALFTTRGVAVLGSNRVGLIRGPLIWSRHSRKALKLSMWLNCIERDTSE